jgi:hypothetical protein
MYLSQLIAKLEEANPSHTVAMGFYHPHSYRGDYRDLAFEPRANVTVGEMLSCAREALGSTYQGYKGGDFTMGEYADVWLANEGGEGEGIGPVLLNYMLNNY